MSVALALGFGVGAFGSAYRTREYRAEVWHKLRVEQRAAAGEPGFARVIFDHEQVPLASLELSTDSEERVIAGRVVSRVGHSIELTYDAKARPVRLSAGEVSATIDYSSDRAEVSFERAGAPIAQKRVPISPHLSGPLGQVAPSSVGDQVRALVGSPFDAAAAWMIPEAHAQASLGGESESLVLRRSYDATVDLRPQAGSFSAPPEIRAACAPHVCTVNTPGSAAAGSNNVTVTVTGSVARAELAKSKEPSGDFRKQAQAERKYAARLLPKAGPTLAGLGLVASACARLDLDLPLCVADLSRDESVGAAIFALRSHELKTDGSELDKRVAAIEDEERARGLLDSEVLLDLCASAKGFGESCNRFAIRPFAGQQLPPLSGALTLTPGLGKDIAGDFELTQNDGADCTFSPSPKTSGALNLRFDSKSGRLIGNLKGKGSGVRSGLSCSLGTASMNWNQSYTMSLSQPVDPALLAAGGKLPLLLSGTMSGSGQYSFSGCRSSGGASGACPGGKNDGYTYNVELRGTFDLDSGKGAGTIVVKNSPLSTQGSWQAPAKGLP